MVWSLQLGASFIILRGHRLWHWVLKKISGTQLTAWHRNHHNFSPVAQRRLQFIYSSSQSATLKSAALKPTSRTMPDQLQVQLQFNYKNISRFDSKTSSHFDSQHISESNFKSTSHFDTKSSSHSDSQRIFDSDPQSTSDSDPQNISHSDFNINSQFISNFISGFGSWLCSDLL